MFLDRTSKNFKGYVTKTTEQKNRTEFINNPRPQNSFKIRTIQFNKVVHGSMLREIRHDFFRGDRQCCASSRKTRTFVYSGSPMHSAYVNQALYLNYYIYLKATISMQLDIYTDQNKWWLIIPLLFYLLLFQCAKAYCLSKNGQTLEGSNGGEYHVEILIQVSKRQERK